MTEPPDEPRQPVTPSSLAWTDPGREVAAATAAPIGPWDAGPALPPELDARIRRDLVRGRKIVRLTWVAALASMVLGLVAVRQAALLVAIDRRLVTTEEVQAAGAWFDAVRSVLIASIVIGGILAIRWLRDALPVLEALRERGVVDGPPARSTRFLDRLPLLWRSSGVPANRAGWADLRVGDGRRVARVAAASVVLAVVVGLVAAIWLGAARDADMSRLLRVVSGVDGVLWLISSILVGVAIDAILWREAAAARALGVFIPLVDAPGRAIFRLIPPLLVFGAGVLVASARPDPWFVPCPQATLACDGMLVPVDHDGGSTATIWIVYAVHRASEAPRGTLAIAVGGPGSSGLAEAVGRVESLDEDLVRKYDILFFDQRGIGASEGRDCPDAAGAYITSGAEATTAAAAYVSSCLTEAEVDPATLSRYATRQAAEDLESIRDRLGIARLAVYGESYGTELAQTYAALHPDRVSALILDGSVDLTRSAIQFWADAAHGFDAVLTDTLAACRADAICEADVADPAAAYADAMRRIATTDSVEYGDDDGVVRQHVVSKAEIVTAIDTLLYDPAGRMLVQRAVAASAHGDLVPLARLINALGSGAPGGFSSFAYHAILCADYRLSPTADPHDAAAVTSAAESLGVPELRTSEVFASPFPCLSWPYQPSDGTRPPPLTATPFPVFVLGATDDPITPIGPARAIAARLTDGYLIVTTGGPHVTFGRNDACVDGPLVAFLLDGRRPTTRELTCAGTVAAPYVALTPRSALEYHDALEAMESAKSELLADPAYRLWEGFQELRVGCRYGGFIAIDQATVRDDLRFADCAFVDGLPLRGTGQYVFEGATFTWSVTVPDGQLEFESNATSAHVSGTWKGRPVDLTR